MREAVREPAVTPVVSRPQFEQRSGGAVRFEKNQESLPNLTDLGYEQQEYAASPVPDAGGELRAQPQAPVMQENVNYQHQPLIRPSGPSVSMRREAVEPVRESAVSGRGFFKRMADAGRALSARNDEDMEEPRVQVVQKPVQMAENVERPARAQDEDQYLDIPAFLRRQAN
jgi:hypothetical protein